VTFKGYVFTKKHAKRLVQIVLEKTGQVPCLVCRKKPRSVKRDLKIDQTGALPCVSISCVCVCVFVCFKRDLEVSKET
jgi:hypothetical protein